MYIYIVFKRIFKLLDISRIYLGALPVAHHSAAAIANHAIPAGKFCFLLYQVKSTKSSFGFLYYPHCNLPHFDTNSCRAPQCPHRPPDPRHSGHSLPARLQLWLEVCPLCERQQRPCSLCYRRPPRLWPVFVSCSLVLTQSQHARLHNFTWRLTT